MGISHIHKQFYRINTKNNVFFIHIVVFFIEIDFEIVKHIFALFFDIK